MASSKSTTPTSTTAADVFGAWSTTILDHLSSTAARILEDTKSVRAAESERADLAAWLHGGKRTARPHDPSPMLCPPDIERAIGIWETVAVSQGVSRDRVAAVTAASVLDYLELEMIADRVGAAIRAIDGSDGPVVTWLADAHEERTSALVNALNDLVSKVTIDAETYHDRVLAPKVDRPVFVSELLRSALDEWAVSAWLAGASRCVDEWRSVANLESHGIPDPASAIRTLTALRECIVLRGESAAQEPRDGGDEKEDIEESERPALAGGPGDREQGHPVCCVRFDDDDVPVVFGNRKEDAPGQLCVLLRALVAAYPSRLSSDKAQNAVGDLSSLLTRTRRDADCKRAILMSTAKKLGYGLAGWKSEGAG